MGFEPPKTINETFNLVNAFLEGFQSNSFFPNSQDCSKYSQIFMNANNETTLNMTNSTYWNRTEFEKVELWTRLISNEFAEAFKYCGLTVVDIYIFCMNQYSTY